MPDSVFPDSHGVLDRVTEDCTAEERYAVTGKKVAPRAGRGVANRFNV